VDDAAAAKVLDIGSRLRFLQRGDDLFFDVPAMGKLRCLGGGRKFARDKRLNRISKRMMKNKKNIR